MPKTVRNPTGVFKAASTAGLYSALPTAGNGQPIRPGAGRQSLGEKAQNFRYRDLKVLLPFVKPHWRLGFSAALIALAGTIVAAFIPLTFKYLADDAVLGGNHRVLNLVIGVIVGALVFIGLADFLKQVSFVRFQQEVIFGVQHHLFDRLLHLPKTFFDSSRTGYLMSRVAGDVFQLQAFFSLSLIDVFTKSLQFIIALTILLYLNWRLTLLSLIILPLFVVTVRLLGGKTRRMSRTAMEKSALVSQDLEEMLAGAALVKAFAAEDRATQKLLTSLRAAFQTNLKRITTTAFFMFLSGGINALGLGCVLWYGASQIIDKQLSVGELLAFSAYLGYLIEPAKFMANLTITLEQAFAAFERVFELMNLVPEDGNDETKIKVTKIRGSVQFDNVSFSYDGRRPALQDISFRASAGQVIAIVGPSGAGKSTLVNLIICLYQPCAGRIFFDDRPVEQLSLPSLRERIGIVSQEIFLFDDSIKNNIRYGKLAASDAAVINAAQMAGAHEFVSKLPDGYETSVGEKGVKLSVGQKQRISIARAILKDPDILILDEATSALDPLTEQAVHQALKELSINKTVFVIAHRLSTARLSDYILVLDHGCIVQRGRHAQLWAEEGLYRQLCQTQLLKTDLPAAQGAKGSRLDVIASRNSIKKGGEI